MFQKSIILTVLACCTILLIMAGSAHAHKVNVFAYAENGTIYTESYFPDGKPVVDGTIEVYGEAKTKLLEGKTDAEGKFSFPIPKKEDIIIVINASMGHRNEYTIKKDEL